MAKQAVPAGEYNPTWQSGHDKLPLSLNRTAPAGQVDIQPSVMVVPVIIEGNSLTGHTVFWQSVSSAPADQNAMSQE